MKKLVLTLISIILSGSNFNAQSATKHGELTYEDFKSPKFCGASCHSDFYQQWKQSMMSQSYVHHWDEIE